MTRTRLIPLLLALVMRIIMLAGITLLMEANEPIFHLTDLGLPQSWFAAEGEVIHPETADEHFQRLHELGGARRPSKYGYEVDAISIRDIVMILGGLFLLRSSVKEIHEKIEHRETEGKHVKSVSTFRGAIMQIAAFDMLFSFDSVITAVGMKLGVSDVGSLAFEMLQRFHRGGDISGCAQVVAVKVHGVW